MKNSNKAISPLLALAVLVISTLLNVQEPDEETLPVSM